MIVKWLLDSRFGDFYFWFLVVCLVFGLGLALEGCLVGEDVKKKEERVIDPVPALDSRVGDLELLFRRFDREATNRFIVFESVRDERDRLRDVGRADAELAAKRHEKLVVALAKNVVLGKSVDELNGVIEGLESDGDGYRNELKSLELELGSLRDEADGHLEEISVLNARLDDQAKFGVELPEPADVKKSASTVGNHKIKED